MSQQTIYSHYSIASFHIKPLTGINRHQLLSFLQSWAILLLLLIFLFSLGLFVSQWLGPLLFSATSTESLYSSTPSYHDHLLTQTVVVLP